MKGIENINKSIQSDINDLMYNIKLYMNFNSKSITNCLKGLDGEKDLKREINRIKSQKNNNKDIKSLYLQFMKIKNIFNNLLPTEISRSKNEMYIFKMCLLRYSQSFQLLIQKIEENMNIDEYKNNVHKINEMINSADVNLNTISNINKILKTNKENLEKEIKNNIINFRYFVFSNINRNEVNEAIKHIPTSNDDKRKLNSIVSNNINFKKGIENVFDQFIKIKSFVENETKEQNENLNRIISKCKTELHEIEDIEYDEKEFERLKSDVELTKLQISNLSLSSIYEKKYV